MNIASPHIILSARRVSNGLCRADSSARSQKVLMRPKLIGLDGDEELHTHVIYLEELL